MTTQTLAASSWRLWAVTLSTLGGACAPGESPLPASAGQEGPSRSGSAAISDARDPADFEKQLAGAAGNPSERISLPLPNGDVAEVSVVSTQMMGPKLTARFPEIKTYVFQSTGAPYAAGHIVVGPSGARAAVRTRQGVATLESATDSSGISRWTYLDDQEDGGVPEVALDLGARFRPAGDPAWAALAIESGPQLRTYKLAATTTGEFYQARGGTEDLVVASLMGDLASTNTVLEPEVAVRLELADVSYDLLYADPATDPFDNASTCETSGDPCTAHSDCDVASEEPCLPEKTACTLREDNRENMDDLAVDPDSYDLGFLFAARAGGGADGCAWYVVCLLAAGDDHKARGAGLMGGGGTNGAGGLLAHEGGHQLGARHTFSGQAGSCTQGEFDAGGSMSQYEPGSGTTRMSYRGNCADDPDDVVDPQDDNVDTSEDEARYGSGSYFHSRSFEEIVDNVFNGDGSTCGTLSDTGNTAPVVDAGSDYTIPRQTPFTLNGSAADAEDAMLTYNWEQYDRADTRRPIDTDDNLTSDGPIIRSVPPTADTSRTVPHLLDLLAGVSRKGEILPQTDRDLNFRLSARDNRMGGGGVAYDTMTVHVEGPPFFVTAPNSGFLQADCPMPVTWEVGGGDVAANVSVLFSADGGLNFDTSLAASTPNDGAFGSTVPCELGDGARVKVAAVDNIFFDVSNQDLFVYNNPPDVSVSTAGGSVDDNCEFLVEFEATATDACAISAADVDVDFFKAEENFSLGTPTINTMQVSPTEVAVTGSIVVYDLLSSPAMLAVKVTATDGCTAASNDFAEAVIVDDTPPTIAASLDPDSLWPPNHKMATIAANVIVQDNCPGVTFALTDLTSNQPDNGTGDGDTVDDIQGADIGTPDVSFSLREERAAPLGARVYTGQYTATDGSDNEAQDSDTVTVPKHQ